MMDLSDAIEKELRIIRKRDGMKYCREVARDLIAKIESDVECQAEMDRDVIRRAVA